MTKFDVTTFNRRSFLTAALGAAAILPASAQQPSAPAPRDWSGKTPVRYPDPDIVALDNRFRRYMIGNTSIKRLVYGNAVGRGSGVERRGALSGVERHPQQRADALARRRRARQRLPQSFRLQQRQHLRLRRTAAFLRARRPARGALRALRRRHRDRRQVRRQAARTRRTTSWCIPTAASGSPTRPTAFAATTKGSRRTSEIKEAVYRVDPEDRPARQSHRRSSTSPTASASRPTTRRCISADTGTAPRDLGVRSRRQKLRNGKRFVQLSGTAPPTASAAMSTATCGRARPRVCR